MDPALSKLPYLLSLGFAATVISGYAGSLGLVQVLEAAPLFYVFTVQDHINRGASLISYMIVLNSSIALFFAIFSAIHLHFVSPRISSKLNFYWNLVEYVTGFEYSKTAGGETTFKQKLRLLLDRHILVFTISFILPTFLPAIVIGQMLMIGYNFVPNITSLILSFIAYLFIVYILLLSPFDRSIKLSTVLFTGVIFTAFWVEQQKTIMIINEYSENKCPSERLVEIQRGDSTHSECLFLNASFGAILLKKSSNTPINFEVLLNDSFDSFRSYDE